MFSVSVDLSEFRRDVAKTKNALSTETYAAVKGAAEAGRDEAKSVGRFKDRTGNLRRTIAAKHVSFTASESVWEIVAPQAYALFVEGGTRPHFITPLHGEFLRFNVGGRVVFARFVKHPGTRGTPFIGPGALKAEAVLTARLESAIERISALWS